MKFFIQIIGIGILFYCVLGTALYLFQKKLLFFPMGPDFGTCPQMDRYNAKAVESAGIRYYIKKKAHPDSWIVIFHGNAGNACDRTYFLDLLSDIKSNLVIFEYPGYGGDKNPCGEKPILEQALALVSHIQKNDTDHLPVYLMGESLGTGVATWVSTQAEIHGLILISAYTSIVDVARNHYPWLPVGLLLKHTFFASTWAGLTTTPAILFHGINDDIIPISFARKQVPRFKGQAELIEIKNCGHNDIVDVGGAILRRKIFSFVSKHALKDG